MHELFLYVCISENAISVENSFTAFKVKEWNFLNLIEIHEVPGGTDMIILHMKIAFTILTVIVNSSTQIPFVSLSRSLPNFSTFKPKAFEMNFVKRQTFYVEMFWNNFLIDIVHLNKLCTLNRISMHWNGIVRLYWTKYLLMCKYIHSSDLVECIWIYEHLALKNTFSTFLVSHRWPDSKKAINIKWEKSSYRFIA